MAKRHRVRVAITGGGVSPETVSLRELADVLARLDRALRSYATRAGLVQEDAFVSLVDVVASSDGLVLSVPDALVPAVGVISLALRERDPSMLPSETYAELHQLSNALASREWGFRISGSRALGIVKAEFGAARPLAPPTEPARIAGSTTLYGRCLRVGGVHPKAEIRLHNGRLLHVELTETLAKEIAGKLYEEVALEGNGTWDVESWEILDFRVARVTSFRTSDPVAAFKELAEAAHGRWDGVDAAAYVQALRAERE